MAIIREVEISESDLVYEIYVDGDVLNIVQSIQIPVSAIVPESNELVRVRVTVSGDSRATVDAERRTLHE